MAQQFASIQAVLAQYLTAPLPHAKLFVRRTTNGALVPLYGDPDLTSQISNPMRASASGEFPECHAESGVYHLMVQDRTGQQVLDIKPLALKGPQDLNIARVFDSVWALLGDLSMPYATESATLLAGVSAGDMLHVTSENLFYRVLEADDPQPHVMTAGGVKLEMLQDELIPEGFPSIEEAIYAAARSGKSLRGTPGKTYVFTEGVTLSGFPINIHFEGCYLVRGSSVVDNQPALRIDQEFSAASYSLSDDILDYSLVEYDYGNGPISVPKISVQDASSYSVGDIIRVMSDDKIPSIAPWTEMRYADMGEVGFVNSDDNSLYMIRPFSEQWNPKKIVRLSKNEVRIIGGKWSDAIGYPQTRNAPMIQITGAVRPLIRDVWFQDTASVQLLINACYEGRSLNNRFDRPRHDHNFSAYGYGEKVVNGTVRHVQNGAIGSGCRHVFDTGGRNLSALGLLLASPDDFGGAVECVCRNGDGMDSLNAPWADHPDAYRTQFINCTSRWSNRRAPGSTLWGLELRGRGSSAEGGEYEGLQPIRIEPSTTIPMVLRNMTIIKHSIEREDSARGSMIDIIGSGTVTGERAEVQMYGVKISQRLGRKEMVYAENCRLTFEGSLRYEADLSNPVVFRLSNSDVSILGLDADFSASVGSTPMLTLLEDNASWVCAPGLVRIRDSQEVGSTVVLTDFNMAEGSATWDNVLVEGSLYSDDGWRSENIASGLRAQTRSTQNTTLPNDVAVNFSGGGGAKPIQWPKGCAMQCIYVSITPTAVGTYVGTIPEGSHVGQRVLMGNVGDGLSFEIRGSTLINVPATREVLPGHTAMLRWNGTQWQG